MSGKTAVSTMTLKTLVYAALILPHVFCQQGKGAILPARVDDGAAAGESAGTSAGESAGAALHQRQLQIANASVTAAAEEAAADPLRPLYHFTAPAFWINDPNGPVYHDGEYHIFYQHNPYGPEWGNMSWGHAVSTDLVYWTHLPIALTPTPGGCDEDGVFSGCCVIDSGVPTICYTGVRPEVQCLARSTDGLRTWTKHEGNPVIGERPRDDLEGFRDPFIWREGGHWYMILGSGIMGEGGAALLYRSIDLLDWEYLHPLCLGFGRNWECPLFFPLQNRHVLVVSPHGPVRYAIGDYVDLVFTPGPWKVLDHGGRSGFYAPNVLRDGHGRMIMWGWVTGGGSEGAPWNGLFTLPRVLELQAGGRLGIAPLPELAKLRGCHFHEYGLLLQPDSGWVVPDVKGDNLELLLDIDPGNCEEVALDLLCDPDGPDGTTVYFDHAGLRLGAGGRSGPFSLSPDENSLRLHVFLDRSVIELYANGRFCLTARCAPQSRQCNRVRLRARGRPALVRSLDIWHLDSIWSAP